ncbi:hypothetical protein Peur_013183 [Populus x canadensis]
MERLRINHGGKKNLIVDQEMKIDYEHLHHNITTHLLSPPSPSPASRDTTHDHHHAPPSIRCHTITSFDINSSHSHDPVPVASPNRSQVSLGSNQPGFTKAVELVKAIRVGLRRLSPLLKIHEFICVSVLNVFDVFKCMFRFRLIHD